MYHRTIIRSLVAFIMGKSSTMGKSALAHSVQTEFKLIRDRSVFYCEWFAIRFCSATSKHFSNTVLALSTLHKYDRKPFIVCLVTPKTNYVFLANSTFLKKVSHSSMSLRCDNIKGSFNGSDIMREFGGVENTPDNFEALFYSHMGYKFEDNLARLVEATNNIVPSGQRFVPTQSQVNCIYQSVDRAISFLNSAEYKILSDDLDSRVRAVEAEILIASLIDNVNIRGRVIEYLVKAEDDLKKILAQALRERQPLPEFFTEDKLGDYRQEFEDYITETDIKTKILFLSSNPKGYNVDKLLSFLSTEKSVYLVYIVAIDDKEKIQTRLCSMFSRQLLSGTRIIQHWAGRNSRGVTQYDGKALEVIVNDFDSEIDRDAGQKFLSLCLHNE